MRGEDEQLRLRLRQEAMRAARSDRPSPGRFLTGEERAMAVHEAREAGVSVSFDGGWPDAERVQACFHPTEDAPVYTGEWVRVSWNAKFVSVDHRDLLGSLMGLGIDRSYFGDLVVQDGCALLYTLPEIALRLPMEWTQAGRATIRVTQLDQPPEITPPEGMLFRDTVASTRLDALLASGMKLSRGKAAEIIRQGAVAVDHQSEERVDRLLEAGQLLSIRGFGRIRIRQVGAPTRKDRLPVELEIFKRT